MNGDRINVSRPFCELCRLFAVEPIYVSKMTIGVDEAEISIFHITEEGETAMETLHFEVSTEDVIDLFASPFDMPPLVEKEPGVDILEWLDRWKERRRQSKGHAWRRWWRA